MEDPIDFYDKKPEYYHFYKTPDGEECLPKTYYYTKYSGITGAVISAYEMILLSKPQTVRACFARFNHFTLPFAGMGFAFGSSLCILGHLRKKNDVTNHILAGMIAGSVWGVRYKRVYHAHVGAVFIGFLAGYFKYFSVNNYPMFVYRRPEDSTNWLGVDLTVKLYDDPGRPNEV